MEGTDEPRTQKNLNNCNLMLQHKNRHNSILICLCWLVGNPIVFASNQPQEWVWSIEAEVDISGTSSNSSANSCSSESNESSTSSSNYDHPLL